MADTIILSNTKGFCKEKRAIVDSFVDDNKPFVFLVTGHFQSKAQNLHLSSYGLAGYYCRTNKERKGGVAIFVKSDVQYTNRTDLDEFNVEKACEVRSIEIEENNMVVTVIYRSPNESFQHFLFILEIILGSVYGESGKKHVIGGTFNTSSIESEELETVLAKYNYTLTANVCTSDQGNWLDNIAVNFMPTSTKVMRDQLSDRNCIKLTLLQGSQKKVSTLLQNSASFQGSKENIPIEKGMKMAHQQEGMSDRWSIKRGLYGSYQNLGSEVSGGASVRSTFDFDHMKSKWPPRVYAPIILSVRSDLSGSDKNHRKQSYSAANIPSASVRSDVSNNGSSISDIDQIKEFAPQINELHYNELCMMMKEFSERLTNCEIKGKGLQEKTNKIEHQLKVERRLNLRARLFGASINGKKLSRVEAKVNSLNQWSLQIRRFFLNASK